MLDAMKRTVQMMTIALIALGLSSCGHIYTKSHSYQAGSGALLNQARVISSVKPMGGEGGFALSAMVYMAGSATLDGPFIWRIQAEGQKGLHQSMTVHRVHVSTSKTRRSEWYPSQYLGSEVSFKPYKKEPEKVFAVFQIPGKLKVYPETDGDIAIIADVSVKSSEQSIRKRIRFQLQPVASTDLEFINLPSEILEGLDDDPREWKW